MTESDADFSKRARAVCDAATDGPWGVTTCCDYWVEPTEQPDPDAFYGIAHCGDIHWPDFETRQKEWEANAIFIALARTALPEALDRLESSEHLLNLASEDAKQLRAECDRLRGEVEQLKRRRRWSRVKLPGGQR